MPVFLLKSILSLVMLVSVFFAVFTMFEVFGRGDKKYDIEMLKRFHRANGIFYFLLFLLISYFCLRFIINTKTELSPRGSFHVFFAVAIVVIFCIKVSFVRVYRQFYGQVKNIGILIAVLSFLMIAFSGGYYLIVTGFGRYAAVGEVLEGKVKPPSEEIKVVLRMDPKSIAKGKELYESKCYLCHDPLSNKTIVGPGHKGILKNPALPVSKRPATPENVMRQIRFPYKDMPSFNYLSKEEADDIVAYLNTL